MASSYYIRCKSCNTGVWVDDIYGQCPSCNETLQEKAGIGIGIVCIDWSKIGPKKDGYHSGVNCRVTSKRDLIEKAASKNLKLEFC